MADPIQVPEMVVTATADGPDPNVFKINGADYYCYFEISESEDPEDHIDPAKVDRTNKIRLTKPAIVNLDIQENLFEPFCSGSITVNNPFDYIEDNHYTTGDGNDYLHVNLCLLEERKNANTLAMRNRLMRRLTLRGDPAPGWEPGLRYTFVITDEGNSVSKTDRSNNFKTYRLVDKNYAKLNQEIPTGKKYPTDDMKKLAKEMDDDRQISVGACIKQVLIDVLGDGVISDGWDYGSHLVGEPNGIRPADQEYITIPANWRYSDLLKYLMGINYSKTGELPVQTILYFDRYVQKYSLKAIDAIFKDNDLLTVEGFGLGDLTGLVDEQTQQGTKIKDGERFGTNKNNPKDSKARINVNEGMLKSVNVTTPMISYGDEYFVNYSAGFRDQTAGTMGQIQISLEHVVGPWKRAFVDVFKLVGGEAQPFVPYNKIRGKTVKTMILTFDRPQTIENIVTSQMVSNLTFLNLQLTIDNQGDTQRQPGTFIDLFKLKSDETEAELYSDGKILGRWFVTKVHHRFFKDSYQNVMQCVKTYVGPDAPEEELPSPVTVKTGLEANVSDTPVFTPISPPDLGPEGGDVLNVPVWVPELPEEEPGGGFTGGDGSEGITRTSGEVRMDRMGRDNPLFVEGMYPMPRDGREYHWNFTTHHWDRGPRPQQESPGTGLGGGSGVLPPKPN